MGVCEDAPDEYCGHVLKPEDAGINREIDDDWHEDTRNAVCLREPTYDGLCVWHADTDEKTAEKLVEARLTPDDVPWEADYVKEHLTGAILRGIALPGGFSFGGCVLLLAEFSDASLSRAKFPDANLYRAEFPDADLKRAEFPDSELGEAKFPNSELEEAEFHRAYIHKADFSDSDLERAEFPDANLTEAEFSDADLEEAEFSDTDLEGAEFPDANLTEADFRRANLTEADFRRANLTEADFRRANLTEADFRRANLEQAEFPGTNLSGTILTEANLQDTEFSGANLRDATFRPAYTRVLASEDDTPTDPLGASLEDAQFEDGTDLRGANLSGARLYQTAFRDVRINDETTFGIDDENPYGKACRYEYDPNTGVSINDGKSDETSDDVTSRLGAAAWTYRRLESLFKENAMDQRARNAHIRKQEAQRTDYKKQADDGELPLKKRLKYLARYDVSTLNWHFHRHGESLQRLLGVSGLLIFFCGIVYSGAGIARSNPEMTYQITLADLTDPGAVLVDLLNGLYFSVITFSTIGYGDFYPASPFSRLLVGIESLAGALFVALFVFVIGRRVAR